VNLQARRLLLLAPAFWPPHGAEALTGYKFWKAALANGWQVDVITRTATNLGRYPNQFNEDTPEFTRSIHLISPFSGLGDKFLANLFGLTTCQVLERGWAWTYLACRQADALIQRHPYQAVISRCLPIEGHLIGLWVKKRWGLPWIANWNDPEPLEMRPRPYIGQSAEDIAWRKRLTLRQIARYADWHTFPCERLRRFIAGYLPTDILGRSSVIPHVALSHWQRKMQPHDKLRLFHAGDIRPPRSGSTLLEGLARFINRCPAAGNDMEVVFAGPGSEAVVSTAQAYGTAGRVVRSLGLLSYQQMNEQSVCSDVGMVIEAPMAEGIFLPSKAIDLIQCGLPLLAIGPRVGTLPDLIASHGGGIAVDVTQPEEIAQALYHIWTLWKGGSLHNELSPRPLLKLYGENAVMAQLEGVLKAIG